MAGTAILTGVTSPRTSMVAGAKSPTTDLRAGSIFHKRLVIGVHPIIPPTTPGTRVSAVEIHSARRRATEKCGCHIPRAWNFDDVLATRDFLGKNDSAFDFAKTLCLVARNIILRMTAGK